ncbi:MAG: tetratricopeptide repeat protein [Phycisphaeraceae bacterium]
MPHDRLASDRTPPWSQVWHLPVLLLGVGVFLLGLYLAMPRPEPFDHPEHLNQAATALQAGNTERATEILDHVEPHLDTADGQQLGRYWQYRGDLGFQQRQRRYTRPADTPAWRDANQRILRDYHRAEQTGRPIDDRSLRRLAETLVHLGREDQALALLDRLEDAPARHRYQLVRRLIEQHRHAAPLDRLDALASLVERFRHELRAETDPARRREQEIWITNLRAQVQLQAGDPRRIIAELPRWIQRLGNDPDLAPLRVRLAQAYERIGDVEQAGYYYQLAQQQIEANDDLNASIHVGLGRIALGNRAGDQVEQAFEHFAVVTREFPSHDVYIDALINRADCEARLGEHDDALAHFALAVQVLDERAPAWDPRRDELEATVRVHIDRLGDRERHEQALELLRILEPLHGDEMPRDLRLEFAHIHERVSQVHHAHAAAPGITRDARRLANREAAAHFEAAARHFHEHARQVTITDDQAHGSSLWAAAENFDRAERWQDAIEVYTEFIQVRELDPMRLRAFNRLGRAYLSDGQYASAVELFTRLLEDHPRSPEAYDSLVPLARAYIALEREDAAERTLLSIVDDHEAITPESDEYQQALIELGKLYYRQAEHDGRRYAQAIERLTEAVDRYGHGEAGAELRYLLADAYRRSVPALDAEIDQQRARQRRVELENERDRRLDLAQRTYNQAVNLLEARADERALTELDHLYLRNAYFYQADAAYDRQRYELAIELYHEAALRWRDHPASLVALVQIFNAHCELGQFQEARVANERARTQLDRIPDEAFQDPTLPMSRRHWEDWLRWTSELEVADG